MASGRAMAALITSPRVASKLEVELIFELGTVKDWKPDTENRHIRRSKTLAAIIGRARIGRLRGSWLASCQLLSDFRAADL